MLGVQTDGEQTQAEVASGPTPIARGWISGRRATTSRCTSLRTRIRCARSAVSQTNWRTWRRGWNRARSMWWRWRRRGCTGFRSTRCWSGRGSKSIWSMRGRRSRSADARVTCATVSGIRELMSYGLLRGAFRPRDEDCVLRSYVRQRGRLVRERARCVQHMQKALTQMNVQLDTVLNDVMGKSGEAIVRAIVGGERDPAVLARMCDRRVKADAATMARALQGNWRTEHCLCIEPSVGALRLSSRVRSGLLRNGSRRRSRIGDSTTRLPRRGWRRPRG